jgi:hypothetical protein
MCRQADDGWCPKENDKEWGFCPDCDVVGALEKLEEENTELKKEVAELKAELKEWKDNALHNADLATAYAKKVVNGELIFVNGNKK